MKIIYYKGVLEALDCFVAELCRQTERRGLNYLVLDAKDGLQENDAKIRDFAKDDSCTAILFNNIVSEHIVNGKNTWEDCEIPVFNILVDHPINYIHSLEKPFKGLHIVCIDKDHKRFIRSYFPQIEYIHFVPHGGTPDSGQLPYRDRDIDVLFVGSCQKEPVYEAVQWMDDRGEAFYLETVQSMLNHSDLTTEEAIKQWLGHRGIELDPPAFIDLYQDCGFRCEIFVRRYFRLEIMKTLSDAGIRVDIYGPNWELPGASYRENIRLHGRTSPQQCVKLAGRAKICLNIMPWFKDGGHERIFTAMVNGAVCVTDPSRWLTERFTDGKDIIFFDMNNPAQLAADINWLLEHPVEAERIAMQGQVTASTCDTWGNRLDCLLGYL